MNKEELVSKFPKRYSEAKKFIFNGLSQNLEEQTETLKNRIRQKQTFLTDAERKFETEKIVRLEKEISELESELQKEITSEEYNLLVGYAEERVEEETPVAEKEIVLMNKFSPVPFAERLIKKNKIIYDKNKVLWKYDKIKGLWLPNCENSLRNYLRKYLMGDEQQKRNYVDEIISYLKDINYHEDFELNQKPYLIAFKNKVFDLKIGEFRNFQENDYLTSKLNIDLDDNFKECPKIDNFFSESIGKKYKSILYDLAAYTLLDGMVPYQKLFFIFGAAGTGKSVYMNLLENFLGKENICSVEPSHLVKDQYSTGRMLFKKSNIVSDIRYDDLEDITIVKKLTGEDTTRIRKMYKEPYDTKLFAKQIFSTNKLPVVKEKTMAWYRRLYLIQFSNIVKQKDRNPFLLKELTSEEELKGLAFRCLEHLKELYKNKFIFTYDIDEKKVGGLYEELSNPVLMFIKENCIEGREEFCFKWEFEERLNNWLRINHFPPFTKSQINQYMKEGYLESNRPYFDKTYRVWIGLRWKKGKESAPLNHFNHFNDKIKQVYIYKRSLQTPLNPLNQLEKEEEPYKTHFQKRMEGLK